LTILIFLLHVVEKRTLTSVMLSKNELIANIIYDSFLLAGSLLLMNIVGTSNLDVLYQFLSEGKFRHSPQEIAAVIFILLFAICKSGLYPLNKLILKESKEYPALFSTKITIYHTGIAFFVLTVIKPLTIIIPNIFISLILILLLLSTLAVLYQSIISKNILYISGNICFATNSLLIISIISDATLSYSLVLYTSMLIIALMLMVSGYITSVFYTDSIWETGNANKYMKTLLIFYNVSIIFLSGLPPFSTFWRNSAIFASTNNIFYTLLVSSAVFLLAFSAMRVNTIVFFNKKKSNIGNKSPSTSLSLAFSILALAAIILSSAKLQVLSSLAGEFINIRTHLSISRLNFNISFICSIAGILSSFFYYLKISEEKDKTVLKFLHIKDNSAQSEDKS